jgi:hypothetical protein
MAATITREMINSRSSADGGSVPSGLYIRDVKEFIPYIERDDTPLVKLIGTGGPIDILKYEHGQGYLMPQTVTVTTAANDSITTIELSNANLVQQYDVLYNPLTEERIWVHATPGANPITVTRGYGGSTAAAIADDQVLTIVGPAVPEGVDTPRSPSIAGDLDWDCPQIFEYSWDITHRGRVIPNYEYQSDRFKGELKRKMVEAARDLEMTAIYGLRYLPANVTDGTMTRGMIAATTANVSDLNGAPLTLEAFLDLEQTKFLDVGPNDMGRTIVLGPTEKRIFNSFINPLRRATASDAKINLTLDSFETDFGVYKFVVHYNHPAGRATILNTNDISRRPLEGGNWVSGLMSTQGWYDKGFLRGDFAFVWPVARRRSALIDFSVNTSDYPYFDAVG